MIKDFVTLEQEEALRELGFDEPCVAIFKNPLKSQVFRWFRDKYGLYANLSSWIHEEELGIYHEFEIYGNPNGVYGDGKYDTYEEAENACINKLIELSKQQDNKNKCLECGEDKGNYELYCSFCRNQI